MSLAVNLNHIYYTIYTYMSQKQNTKDNKSSTATLSFKAFGEINPTTFVNTSFSGMAFVEKLIKRFEHRPYN
jgi:hypothetical protein